MQIFCRQHMDCLNPLIRSSCFHHNPILLYLFSCITLRKILKLSWKDLVLFVYFFKKISDSVGHLTSRNLHFSSPQLHERLFYFFSRTTWLKSTKFGTNHSEEKGSKVYSNEGSYSLQKGDNEELVQNERGVNQTRKSITCKETSLQIVKLVYSGYVWYHKIFGLDNIRNTLYIFYDGIQSLVPIYVYGLQNISICTTTRLNKFQYNDDLNLFKQCCPEPGWAYDVRLKFYIRVLLQSSSQESQGLSN